MLYCPEIGLSLQALGSAIRFDGSLPARAREIAILAVAKHHKSDYGWSSHEAVGRALGLLDKEIEAIRESRPADFADPFEREVLLLSRMILSKGDLADRDYEHAEAKLGAQGLFELTTLLGYYSLIATQLRIFRV
jgi:4-carboxymuconolactone decarboxylase